LAINCLFLAKKAPYLDRQDNLGEGVSKPY
jgi:hypothetical protein